MKRKVVEMERGRTWKARAADWSSRPAGDRLAEWDYFDLLFDVNRAAALKSVSSVLTRQDLPAEALGMIEALDSTYGGQPYFTYLHAQALDALGRKTALGEDPRLFSESSALALAAYRWEGGESGVSSRAEGLIYERRYEKYADEPPRWYRHEVPTDRGQAERTSFSQREIERNDSYRMLIEDFASRLQLVVPYSWAAAFEAKYARDAATRRVALAAAVILDPKSERISQFSGPERAAVRGAAVRTPGFLGAALRQLAGQAQSRAP